MKIHPTAIVSPDAQIADNVQIGPFSIIHPNVVLGANTVVDAYCELGISNDVSDGSPLRIGENAWIRSHAVFYEGSSFGPGLNTGHRVTAREGTVAGARLQLGPGSYLQGDCELGHDVRLQSHVLMGKKSKVGNFVWLYPHVVLTNDPTPPSDFLLGAVIEDFAVVATMTVILPGVTVGHHSLVGAHSSVRKNVPPYKIVSGMPARVVGDINAIKRRDGSGLPAYPWTAHFHRGYPKDVVAAWLAACGEAQPDES